MQALDRLVYPAHEIFEARGINRFQVSEFKQRRSAAVLVVHFLDLVSKAADGSVVVLVEGGEQVWAWTACVDFLDPFLDFQSGRDVRFGEVADILVLQTSELIARYRVLWVSSTVDFVEAACC